MRRTKEAAEASRRIIIDASFRIFLEKGYAATNLDDIAKAINMTRGVIYWHFRNKLDLFVSLLNEVLDESIAKAENVFMAEDALPDKFKRLLNQDEVGSRLMELLKAFHPATRELDSKALEATFKTITKKVSAMFTTFERFILKEQAAGRIRSDIDSKAFVASFIMMAGMLNAPSHRGERLPLFSIREKKRDKIFELLWNGLGSAFVNADDKR